MSLELHELAVLLVEPSSTQRKIIEGHLHNLGIANIGHADSGDGALAAMGGSVPDLVISALYLPDMTGTELVERMRGDAALQQSAFMLISSETRFRYLDPIRQAGAIAILPKPFDPVSLKVALDATLDYLQPQSLELDRFDPESLEVLVVDDSLLARKHIRRVLTNMGLERITEATDGREAVQQLSRRFFDLIVTDYNMPQMDGRELVDFIRGESEQASVPVLMATSEANQDRLAAVQQAGVSAICDKPFNQQTVHNLVKQLVNRV